MKPKIKILIMDFLFKLLAVLILYFTTFYKITAQSWEHFQKIKNYWDLILETDAFFERHSDLTICVGSGYKDYRRWSAFWEGRTDMQGSFSSYQVAMGVFNTLSIKNPPSYIPVTWNLLGPTTTPPASHIAYLGIVNELWVNPADPNHLLAGSNSGGLFETTDGGQNWKALTNQLVCFGVQSVYVNPSNIKEIFIATGTSTMGKYYSQGIWKTNDGGIVWEETGFGSLAGTGNYIIKKLLVHSSQTNIMYAIYDQEFMSKASVARSNDNGQTWQQILVVNDSEIFDIEFKPGNPDIIYIGGGNFVRKYDGQTWTDIQLQTGSGRIINRVEIAVTNQNPDLVMILCQSYDPSNQNQPDYKTELYRSTDGGNYFNKISPNLDVNTVGYWKMEMQISPNNINHIYIGGLYVYKFNITSGTATVISITKPYHSDVRSLTVLKNNNADHIYIGNDGGVTRSEDGGTSWIDMSKNGLAITQFWGMGIADNSPLVVCGPQDGNYCIFNYQTGNWKIMFGDAYNAVINYNDPNLIFVASDGVLAKSTNGANSFSYIQLSQFNEKLIRNYALAMHPKNPDTILIGLENVRIYRNSTGQFSLASSFPDPAADKKYAISTIAVSPSNPDVVYAARGYPQWSDQDQRRLFKTKDFCATWSDITPAGQSLKFTGISDITIHPDDPDKIWISLSRNMADYKVLYSDNGGADWYNFSDGIPNIPVNCIRYLRYARLEGLVAGTDAGVFIRTSSMAQWIRLGNNLPLTIVTDIELYKNTPKILAATFGRGLWEADLCNLSKTTNLNITGNENWSTVKYIDSDVFVKNGATLNITSTVYMYCGCGILVEKGGTLIINGGHVTSENGIWKGITVLGDPSKDHIKNKSRHGLVRIENNGQISNASTGIKAGYADNSPDSGPIPENGGIIQADNGVFRDNMTAIELFPYAFDNISYIRNSTFENTNALNVNTSPNFFIKLHAVRIQDISNCFFKNLRTTLPLDSPARGSGIYAWKSSIKSACRIPITPCPPDQYYPNKFENLYYGIEALGPVPHIGVSIIGNRFLNNYRSLYLSGIINANILYNEFSINTAFIQNGGYGCYLDGCTGYQTEGNTFHSSDLSEKGVGIIVNNSGGNSNEIYRNSYSLNEMGISAQGNNRNTNTIQGEGLQLRCNQFIGAAGDICVPNPDMSIYTGIAKYQGNIKLMAGNFFQIPGSVSYDDINNKGEHITYYYPAGYTYLKPIDFTSNTVLPSSSNVSWNFIQSCPSKSGSIGGLNPDSLRIVMGVNIEIIDSLQNHLRSLIDGGNTSVLLALLWGGSSQNSAQVYDSLMQYSPYLSDSVLSVAIFKQDVLNDMRVRDILVANPHSAKSGKLMQQLTQIRPNMPGLMLSAILKGKDFLSPKEETESILSEYKLDNSWVVSALARIYQDESDSLKWLWRTDNSLISKYLLAFHYLEEGDTIQGAIVLDSIPLLFQLSGEQWVEHQQMDGFYNIVASLYLYGENLNVSDPLQINSLFDILSRTTGLSSVFARNILLESGLISYDEPVHKPETTVTGSLKSNKPSSPAGIMIDYDISFARIFVEYIFPLRSVGKIEITDNDEKLIFSTSLKKHIGRMKIKTKKWKPGKYTAALYVNSHVVDIVQFRIEN